MMFIQRIHNVFQSRKESFTGLVEIDELPSGRYTYHLHIPPYVSQLELTREGKSLARRRSGEALEAKGETGITVNGERSNRCNGGDHQTPSGALLRNAFL